MAESLTKVRAARLPLGDALASHKTRHDDFFPSRVASEAIAADSKAAGRLVARLTRGYQPARAETVEVPKWGGGTRPALDMDVEDRVIYDSLTASLRDALPHGLVNWSPKPADRRAGENAIAESDARFVLRTDVHACYEYIQHSILEGELLDLTGEDELVGVLIALLGATSGKATGLPQGPDASRTLADVYLSIVDRTLARDGVTFLRWSDDYRVPASSWRQAHRVQARLEHGLRSVGLTINGSKTRIPARETYATWLKELRLGDGAFPFVFSADYETGEISVDVDGEYLNTAVQAVRRVLDKPDHWGDSYDQSWRLVDSLTALTSGKDPRATAWLGDILWSFPHLTKNVARYVRSLLGTEHESDAAAAMAEAIESRRYLFDWQLGWILHAVIPAEYVLPPSLITAAESTLANSSLPWFVRGRAAVLLSTEQALKVDVSLASLSAEAPDSSRVDFVAGVANSPVSDMRSNILKDARRRPLHEAVINLVEEAGVANL